MCYRPIRIINKSRSFSSSSSPLFLYVPCGKCEQCLTLKQNDWFIRAFSQWRTYEQLGGSTFFVTLTYRDADLPIHGKYRVFNKRHIQNFIKKLKIYLARRGLPDNIGYFITCEYGSKTDRPHYHGLLYFPYKIDSFQLHNLSNNGFIDRAWIYGFNSFSKKYGAQVKSSKALRYCIKYISKYSEIYKQVGLLEYFESIEDSHIYKPFHLQNKGFGLSLKDCITTKQLESNIIPYIEDSKTVFNYSIPVYIKRYMMYNYDKDNCLYRLNDKGISIKMIQTYKRISNIIISFTDFFSDIDKFCYGVTDEILQYFQVDCPDTLQYEINNRFNGNYENLAYYYLFFRFVSTYSLSSPVKDVKKHFESTFTEYLRGGKIYTESPLTPKLLKKLKPYCYESIKPFTDYFYICSIYDEYMKTKNKIIDDTKRQMRFDSYNVKKHFTHD